MAKFNEYTVKATPEDADTLMLYDAAAKSNKLTPFSGIWNWMVNKLTNAVINNLQTSNKTVVGALNELNSKRPRSVPISKSGSALQECLNCLVLIVSPNAGAYDLYSCIGYQSDEKRSKVTLLAGEGLHKITYSDEGTSYAARGIYTIANGNAANEATAYILPLT